MSSLVQELLIQVLDPKTAVTDLLRKVKVVATKLDVRDVLAWVGHELDGYPEDSDIPDYREMRGVAKAFNPLRGWLKIEFGEDHDLEQQLSTQKSRQPISEIEEMADRDGGVLTFIAPSALIGRIQYASDPRIFVSQSQVVRIIDAVRNRILDWALALEERGVLGDGLSFSPEDRALAAAITYNVTHNQTINGDVGVAGNITGGTVTTNVGTGPMESLAAALKALAAAAEREPTPVAPAIIVLADQAANEAASPVPDPSRLERLIVGAAAVVQGIASLGPAWTAVTTEAAKFGLRLVLPGQ